MIKFIVITVEYWLISYCVLLVQTFYDRVWSLERFIVSVITVIQYSPLSNPNTAQSSYIKKHCRMTSFICILQAYVRHPELAAARANRDYVLKQVCDAVNTIGGVAQATGQTDPNYSPEGAGELAAALDEFDVSIVYCHLFLRPDSIDLLFCKSCFILIIKKILETENNC